MYILCTINNPKYRYFFQFEQLDFSPKECPGLYRLFFFQIRLYTSPELLKLTMKSLKAMILNVHNG